MPSDEFLKAYAAMLTQNGFFIATHKDVPRLAVPIACINGKAYEMRLSAELVPERFIDGTILNGPYPK